MEEQYQKNKKRSEKLILICASLTFLASILAATFAYFTPEIEGNDIASSVAVQTASLANIRFVGTDEIAYDQILPGWLESYNFTVETLEETTTPTTFKINLIWRNSGITDMEYKLVSLSTGTLNESPADISQLMGDETIAEFTVPAGPARVSSFQLKFRFTEIGSEQNNQQGKTFGAKVYISLDEGQFFNSEYPNGTNVEPSSIISWD